MRSRPRSIAFLSTLFFLIPFATVAALFFQAEFSFAKISALWTWNHTLLFVACGIIAAAVWSVRPWGYFTCLGLIGIGVLDSLIAYCQSPDLGGYLFLIATVILSAVTVYLFQRQVSSPYFNPRERWWETPTRYRAQFQVLASIQGKEQPIELVDISRSGCYIKKVDGLLPGDLLHVHIVFLDVRVDLMTKVVRSSAKPIEGIGLMFMDLTRADRKDLTLLLDHLQNHKRRFENDSPSTAA